MTKSKNAQHGDIIREVRHGMRLGQREFGSRLGVSGRTVMRWEHGKSAPTPAKLQDIADIAEIGHIALSQWFRERMGLPHVASRPTEAQIQEQLGVRRETFEASLYLAADALDVTARNFRATLKRWLQVVRGGNLSLKELEDLLDESIAKDSAGRGVSPLADKNAL